MILNPSDPLFPVLSDFRNLLWIVLQHLFGKDPTRAQDDFANYLQHGGKRIVGMAFRGIGKSLVCAAFVCWLLLRDPTLSILVVSASQVRARAFSTQVRRLIQEIPILQHLRADGNLRDSNDSFDVVGHPGTQEPSVKSVGITGQITGSRADYIIADDCETLGNALSHKNREELQTKLDEFTAVLKPDTPHKTSRVIFLGTPQTRHSIYVKSLPAHGYEVRVWPARVPADPSKYVVDRKLDNGNEERQETLAPYVRDMIRSGIAIGTPVDPERFNEDDLLDRELTYGRSGFVMQFMLDTSLSDEERNPLKLRDWIVTDLNPQFAPVKIQWSNDPKNKRGDLPNVGLPGDGWFSPLSISPETANYDGAVMVIDPSGRGKDETAYVVVKNLMGYYFLLDAGGFQDGYGEKTRMALAQVGKKYEVNHVLVEANFGDGAFTELLKPDFVRAGHPVTIEECKHSRQKELRICDTLEPVLNSHRLVVDASLIQRDARASEGRAEYSLFYQLSNITRDKGALRFDDRLDALAMAISYWSESMARNVQDNVKDRLDELLSEEMEKFYAEFNMAGTTTERRWQDL